jgi:uncharacterized membrane protein
MRFDATIFNRTALTGYFGLLVLLFLWNTVIPNSPLYSIFGSLLIALVPLLLPLRGLLDGNLKAFIGAAMLSLLYFLHGVATVFEPGDSFPATLEILFSLMLFTGATVFVHQTKPH